MRKYVMVLGMMMTSAIIFAQSKTNSYGRGIGQADKLKKELALDDVQYKSVIAINEEYAEKIGDLKRDSSISNESQHEQMRRMHHERDAAISKVLTSEQNAKWTSLRSDKRGKHSRSAPRSHEDHAARMQKSLSLTDEQVARIKTIDQEFVSKFQALKNDSTLAREDSRSKSHQLRKDYQTKTKAVLNQEQLAKWEAAQAEHRRKKR